MQNLIDKRSAKRTAQLINPNIYFDSLWTWTQKEKGNWDPNYFSIVVNISNITPHFENKLRAHGVFARVISANITGDKKWRKHKNQLGSVEREGRSTAEPSRAPHRQPVIWRILEEMRFITYLARPAWLPLSLVIFSVFPYRGGKMLNS